MMKDVVPSPPTVDFSRIVPPWCSTIFYNGESGTVLASELITAVESPE